MNNSPGHLSQDHPRPSRRPWGFRFSPTDAAALIAFGALAAGLHRLDSSLWWVAVVAAGHFFLFCNVFRVARRRELVWAGLFVVNVGLWVLLGRLDWFSVLACQMPVSSGVIAWEIKTLCYHGSLADRLNPNLKDFLEGRIP
jgi:hypothetical protein